MAGKRDERSEDDSGGGSQPWLLSNDFGGVRADRIIRIDEREYLSRPSMDLEREATEAKFYSHVLEAREGATGGMGTAGGGCGCN